MACSMVSGSTLPALIKAMHEGQNGIAALQSAQAEVQAHQADIEALAAAIRARQIALAKAKSQAAIIAAKGGDYEID